jgi:hypothetical protein
MFGPTVPCRVACSDCDAEHLGSEATAKAAGWTRLLREQSAAKAYAPPAGRTINGMFFEDNVQSPWWTHTGLCPMCQPQRSLF